MIKYASHNSLLTIHFCFRVFRYFPPGWLFPCCSGPCPAKMWHSSYWHSKKIWLWIPPPKGHQREWCQERGPLDNDQTVAQWLRLWKHKKGLLGVMWKTWCWISWYESLHTAHLLCFYGSTRKKNVVQMGHRNKILPLFTDLQVCCSVCSLGSSHAYSWEYRVLSCCKCFVKVVFIVELFEEQLHQFSIFS